MKNKKLYSKPISEIVNLKTMDIIALSFTILGEGDEIFFNDLIS